MGSLVSNLLDLARIDSGRLQLRRRPTLADEVLVQTYERPPDAADARRWIREVRSIWHRLARSDRPAPPPISSARRRSPTTSVSQRAPIRGERSRSAWLSMPISQQSKPVSLQ
nr:hypothetical protein [Cyanobium sp. Maggiore-St4-Cus]